MTGEPLTTRDLIPNIGLRKVIIKHLETAAPQASTQLDTARASGALPDEIRRDHWEGWQLSEGVDSQGRLAG